MEVLGIDIGGTGIKGAPVDTDKGELMTERHRIPTPQPATPEAVIETAARIIEFFDWSGPICCGFPAVIQHGVVRTAANIDDGWIDLNVEKLFRKTTGHDARFLNDADAAGLAEMSFGAGKGHKGLVAMVTFGTGIGTALFTNRHLVPNTELGHIEIDGVDGELMASSRVREKEELSWKKWGKRVDTYLSRLEALIWPDLIIIGGSASKKHDRFFEYLDLNAEILPAELRNNAGIIGAAMAACSEDF